MKTIIKLIATPLLLIGFKIAAEPLPHPYIIVKDAEHEALRTRADRGEQPFAQMREDAAKISRDTQFVETADIRSRSYQLTKIMDSSALSYILAPTAESKKPYRDRIYAYFKYWQLSQPGNIPKDMTVTSWDATVPPTASFFATLVAFDIIYNDTNGLTEEQASLRENFNLMMETPGTPYIPATASTPAVPATQGAAQFITNQYEPYHLESLMSGRALWALWKDGPGAANTALSDAVTGYKNAWLGHITESGMYREFGGYSMARAGEPSRYNKGVFHDVIVYTGIDPTWYANPKMGRFYEWLGGYAMMPNRYTWPLGDTSYAPFNPAANSAFERAGNFTGGGAVNGLAFAEWQRNGVQPAAKLFSYLARHRATVSAAPKEARSRIYPDGAAYFRQKDGGTNALAAVLTNQTYTDVGMGHRHADTNSLSIASFGEILLRNAGYNGYASPATSLQPNNFGFDFRYVNTHAISNNVALFNYDPLNGSVVDRSGLVRTVLPTYAYDHGKKDGGSGVQGMLSEVLDYASGFSGPLNDPNHAINRGEHTRHVVAIYPQDGVNGYVIAMDELQGAPYMTRGQLVWHPYSDEITFNSDNASDDRYEWKIHQNANKVDQLYFSIFMPTVPTNKRQFDGLFADDISGGNTSFVGKYLFNDYSLDSVSRKKNVLTLLYPRKSTDEVPTMSRITAVDPQQPTLTSQASALAFNNGVTDFVMESDGSSLRRISPTGSDAQTVSAKGKLAVYRKINPSNQVAFFFVGKGTRFNNAPTGYNQGFDSNNPVDVYMRYYSRSAVGKISSAVAGNRVTLYIDGCRKTTTPPTVKINDVVVPVDNIRNFGGGRGWVRIAVPVGSTKVELVRN